MIRCPSCGRPTTVLETRDDERRRRCSLGHRISTREVLVTELEAAKQAVDKLAAVQRAMQ